MEGWQGCPFPSSATASTSAKTQIRATTARALEEEVVEGMEVEVGAVEEEGEEEEVEVEEGRRRRASTRRRGGGGG